MLLEVVCQRYLSSVQCPFPIDNLKYRNRRQPKMTELHLGNKYENDDERGYNNPADYCTIIMSGRVT